MLPHEFTCIATDINVDTIKWVYRFFGHEFVLYSASNTNELVLNRNPTVIGMFVFYCIVISDTGQRYEKAVSFEVTGKN